MDDRSDPFRKTAGDCLALARTTTDRYTRLALITMAQKLYDMANGPTLNFDGLVRDYNDAQMSRH